MGLFKSRSACGAKGDYKLGKKKRVARRLIGD